MTRRALDHRGGGSTHRSAVTDRCGSVADAQAAPEMTLGEPASAKSMDSTTIVAPLYFSISLFLIMLLLTMIRYHCGSCRDEDRERRQAAPPQSVSTSGPNSQTAATHPNILTITCVSLRMSELA